jgi:hypothetical protein
VDDADLVDASLTFVDKDVFHLHHSYLAARGRYFGAGTASGWALSHGGLLPEEVIIPVAEWFGDGVSVQWPEILFPDGASRDRDRWILNVQLRNTHTVALFGIHVRITLSGESHQVSHSLPRLGPNDTRSFTVEVPTGHIPPGDTVSIDVRLTLSNMDNDAVYERVRQYAVPKAKQFVIRTAEQAAFEDLF